MPSSLSLARLTSALDDLLRLQSHLGLRTYLRSQYIACTERTQCRKPLYQSRRKRAFA